MNTGKYFPNGWYASFVLKHTGIAKFEVSHAHIYNMNVSLDKTNFDSNGPISLVPGLIRQDWPEYRDILTHPIPVQKDPGPNWVEYLKTYEEDQQKVADSITKPITDSINYFGNEENPKLEDKSVTFTYYEINHPEKDEEHFGYEYNLNSYVNHIAQQVKEEEQFQKEYENLVNLIKDYNLQINQKEQEIKEIKKEKVYSVEERKYKKERIARIENEIKNLKLQIQTTQDAIDYYDKIDQTKIVTEDNLDKIGSELYELGIQTKVNDETGETFYSPPVIRYGNNRYYGQYEIFFERRISNKFMFKTYKPSPPLYENYHPEGWDTNPIFGMDFKNNPNRNLILNSGLGEGRPHAVLFFQPFKKYEEFYNLFTFVDHNKFIEYCKKPDLYRPYPAPDPTRFEIIRGTDNEVQPFIILVNNQYLFDIIIKTHDNIRIFVCHYNNFWWHNSSSGQPCVGHFIIKELHPKIYSKLFCL